MNTINYEKIKYHVVYGKVKNVYIQIKNGEVIVKAPKFITKNRYNCRAKKKLDIKKVRRKQRYSKRKRIY